MKLLTILFFAAINIYSQCSDAGVCSIGGSSHSELKKHTIALSYTFGKSSKTDDLTFNSVALFAKAELFEATSVSISLPFNAQSGPAGSVSGMGDPIILLENVLLNDPGFSLTAHAGVKLALGEDNKNSLPQPYQSGLGSNDFLLGISALIDNFSLGAGYQMAGARNNNILQLKRGDDLLIRGGYSFNLNPDYYGSLELLAIKRLQLSSITNFAGGYVDVPKSDQLQINLAANFTYKISENINLNIFGAIPLMKREVNLDGLTRALSLAIGTSYMF